MKRLAIVTTHPIQYNAPLFAKLSSQEGLKVKVYYTWGETARGKVFDPGFGISRSWDIPLLEGYEYEFVTNTSSKPGSNHFWGIQNPTLISEIEQFAPHAILIYGWSFYSHLKVMRYFKDKVKILFRGDSTLLNEPKAFTIKKQLRRIFLRWVYKNVSTSFYCGTNNREYFLTNGLKEDALVFAPHTIDNQRFKDADLIYTQEAALWRKKIGISPLDIVFLFAGKLEQVKNVQLLINAFLKLPKGNVRLIIAGDGPLEKDLRKLGHDKAITFLPFQNQSKMPVLYRMADVFVLPSRSETWGLSLNEAMACAKAVIASNKCGGAIDLIMNGVNGYIFKNDDQEDLVYKMNLLLDKQIVERFGNNSADIIEQFSLDAVCKAIQKSI